MGKSQCQSEQNMSILAEWKTAYYGYNPKLLECSSTVNITCSYLLGNAGMHRYNGNPVDREFYKSMQNLHNDMITELRQQTTPKLNFALKKYFPGLPDSFDTTDILEKLVKNGEMSLIMYNLLLKIFTDIDVTHCSETIKEYTDKINVLNRHISNARYIDPQDHSPGVIVCYMKDRTKTQVRQTSLQDHLLCCHYSADKDIDLGGRTSTETQTFPTCCLLTRISKQCTTVDSEHNRYQICLGLLDGMSLDEKTEDFLKMKKEECSCLRMWSENLTCTQDSWFDSNGFHCLCHMETIKVTTTEANISNTLQSYVNQKLPDKKCFRNTFQAVVQRSINYTEPYIKRIICHFIRLIKRHSDYRTADVLFAMCYVVLIRGALLPVNLEHVVSRTSSPSQAWCLCKSILSRRLLQEGRFDEALRITEENMRRIDLDVASVYNCGRILNVIYILRKIFVQSNDTRLLDIILTHLCEGLQQLKDIKTDFANLLNKRLREHINFYVLQRAESWMPRDSKLSLHKTLLQCILEGDVSACRSAVKAQANVNICLNALFQAIQMERYIVHLGNDLTNESPFSIIRCQQNVIRYLLTTGVSEDIIEKGLSLLKAKDSRRETTLNGVCHLLETDSSRLELEPGIVLSKVQYGRICEEKTENDCFLAHVKVNINIKNKIFAGKQISFKNPERVSFEGIKVAMSAIKKSNPFSDEDHDKIKEIINEESERLWSLHSNLNIISACTIKSYKNAAILVPKLCIVLYCSSKGFIPNNEPRFPDILHTRKGDIAIDVREGYFMLGYGQKPEDFNKPLLMGGSVGLSGMMPYGSIGPFIQLPNNDVGFLTCAHVFYTPKSNQHIQNFQKDISRNDKAVQPPDSINTTIPANECRQCGNVVLAIFASGPSQPTGIDVAVVNITDRIPKNGAFATNSLVEIKHSGFPLDHPPLFNSGSMKREIGPSERRKNVIKFGSKTGLTKGSFHIEGIQVVTDDISFESGGNAQSTFCFKGMYEIISNDYKNVFFQGGDSGAGVFIVEDNNDLHCIGIAIGCTTYGTAIVEPIGYTLDSISTYLPVSLKQFHQEMEEDN